MPEADNKPTISEDEYRSMVYKDGESLVVDLSNVQEMKFEVIPKGVYTAEVDQVDFIEASQSSGAPMLEHTFRVVDGEFAGRKLKFWTSFSVKALSGSKTALLRLDPNIFNGQFKPQDVAESGQLLGKKVRIKVDIGDYQGRETNRISYILPFEEGKQGGEGFFKSAAKAA